MEELRILDLSILTLDNKSIYLSSDAVIQRCAFSEQMPQSDIYGPITLRCAWSCTVIHIIFCDYPKSNTILTVFFNICT